MNNKQSISEQRGFSELLVILVILVLVVLLLASMVFLRRAENGLVEVVVTPVPVSSSLDNETIEKEIDETVIEFPESEFSELESTAAEL